MEPISNADRLAALLRQRLLERARTAGRSGKGETAGTRQESIDRVYGTDPVEARDERQLRRSLIQTILADEFGSELMNEAEFQQVVDRVVETIDADEAGGLLMGRVAKAMMTRR
jgi:hypothetical protein